MKYHFFTMAILLAALAMYALGMDGEGSLLLLVGVALETWFWVRAIRGNRRVASANAQSKA